MAHSRAIRKDKFYEDNGSSSDGKLTGTTKALPFLWNTAQDSNSCLNKTSNAVQSEDFTEFLNTKLFDRADLEENSMMISACWSYWQWCGWWREKRLLRGICGKCQKPQETHTKRVWNFNSWPGGRAEMIAASALPDQDLENPLNPWQIRVQFVPKNTG